MRPYSPNIYRVVTYASVESKCKSKCRFVSPRIVYELRYASTLLCERSWFARNQTTSALVDALLIGVCLLWMFPAKLKEMTGMKAGVQINRCPQGCLPFQSIPNFPTTYSAIRPSFARSAPSSLVTMITLLRNHLRSLIFVARPLTSHLFLLLFNTYWNAWRDAFQVTRTRRCAVKRRRVYSSKCEDCAHPNWNLCPQ